MARQKSKASYRRDLIDNAINNASARIEQERKAAEEAAKAQIPDYAKGMTLDDVNRIIDSYNSKNEIPTLEPNTTPSTPTASTPSIADELERMKKAKADTTTPRTEGEQKAIDTYYDSLMKASGSAPKQNTPTTDYKAEIERMNALKADTSTPRTEGENKAIDEYLRSLTEAQAYVDSQKPKVSTQRKVQKAPVEKATTQTNPKLEEAKNVGRQALQDVVDGKVVSRRVLSTNEQRDYERAKVAQGKAIGKMAKEYAQPKERALSANEQRDVERAQNAIAKAKEREIITTETESKAMPTTAKENAEELQFGQIEKQKPKATPTPKSISADYYNNLMAMGEEEIANEYAKEVNDLYQQKINKANQYKEEHKPVYDERGFETNQSIVNRYLDPSKKLTKDEAEQAEKMIRKFELSDLAEKNENAYTLAFDDAHPDGISVPYYTVEYDENGIPRYDPSKELTPEEREYKQSMYALKSKLSDSESYLLGTAQAIPGVNALMTLGDTDGSYANWKANASRQNPLAYYGGLISGTLAENVAAQAMLGNTVYGEKLRNLAGANGRNASLGQKLIADMAMDAPIDFAFDTIPTVANDLAEGKGLKETAKDFGSNMFWNALFNVGGATLNNFDDIAESLGKQSKPSFGGLKDIPQLEGEDFYEALRKNPYIVEELNRLRDPSKSVRVGKATTIFNPYWGEKPKQIINQRERVPISIADYDNAATNIRVSDIDSKLEGRNQKKILTKVYETLFGNQQTSFDVPVEGMNFDGSDYNVTVNKNAISKICSDPNLSPEKLAVIDNLNDVIKKSEYLDSGEYVNYKNINKNKNVIRYDYFETDVRIGDTDYVVTFDVEVVPGKNNYRTHKIINEINLTPTSGEMGPVPTAQELSGLSQATDRVADSLSDLNVNQIDNSVNPLSPLEDTVGGTGNPIVPNSEIVPNQPNGKVSQFITNTARRGTNLTPEEYQKNINLSDFMLESKDEEQSMMDAFDMIKNEGKDGIVKRLVTDDPERLTQSEIDALMSITRTNNATARAMEAVGEDASAIRAETNAIYKKLRQQSSSNAQGMQALAKWTRNNTPEGMLMYAENFISGNVEVKGSKLQELLKKFEKYKKQYDFSPEFEAKFMDEAEKLLALPDMDSREAKDIMAGLGRMVNEQIPVKLSEKAQAFLMDNMLGNVRTLLTRNAGGNLGLAGVEQTLTRPLASLLDKGVALKTGKRTQAGLSKEGLIEYIQGFRKGLADEAHDLKTGLHTARTGENTLDNAITSNRHVFKNKLMDIRDSLIKNGLSVGDRPFYEANYKQTLGDYYRLRDQGVMGEVIQNLSDEDFQVYAETAARLNALASVYQNDSKMSNALMSLKNGIGDLSEAGLGVDILSQFSMPFVKTPANVIDRAIDYSPLGAVRNIVRTAREGGIKGKNFDQNRFVNETARNIIGTGLMGAEGYAAHKGLLGGGYSNKKNVKQAQKDANMQEYALNLPEWLPVLGGDQMDIGWIPIVGSNAVAAAATVDAFKNGKGNALSNVGSGLKAGSKAMFDQSMFQGMQRLFGTNEAYDSDSSIGANILNVIANGVGQIIPSDVRQVAQITDKYARDLANSNNSNYNLNNLFNSIPYVREKTLAPRIGISGNPIMENQGRNIVSKIVEDAILPGKITDVNYSPLDIEAMRLEEATGNEGNAYRPKADRSAVDVGEKPMTNQEWVDYERRFKRELTAIGNAVMKSDFYQKADDVTKEAMLNEAYGAVKSGVNSDYTGKEISGLTKAYKEAGGDKDGIRAVVERMESKYNPYGLDADAYEKELESGTDMSVFEGYPEALEEYGLNDNSTNREAWKNGGGEEQFKFTATMNENGLGDYSSESAHDAYNNNELDTYKDYRQFLKDNELSDTMNRWSDFKSGEIGNETEEQISVQQVLASKGLPDNVYSVKNYERAVESIPNLEPEEYATTYQTIDSIIDNKHNNSITQKEIIAYLNFNKVKSENEGKKIWNAYLTNYDTKTIPVLVDGKWTTKK